MKFQSKTTVSLHRCAMIEIVFFDTIISDFAKFIAPCRANNSTSQTLRTCSFKCAEDVYIVGLVDLRAHHSAKI
jgi:hypothetical protein